MSSSPITAAIRDCPSRMVNRVRAAPESHRRECQTPSRADPIIRETIAEERAVTRIVLDHEIRSSRPGPGRRSRLTSSRCQRRHIRPRSARAERRDASRLLRTTLGAHSGRDAASSPGIRRRGDDSEFVLLQKLSISGSKRNSNRAAPCRGRGSLVSLVSALISW